MPGFIPGILNGGAVLIGPAADGTDGQVLATNGAGVLEFVDAAEGGGAVESVNGQTGEVVLAAADVGAAASSHAHAQSDVTNLVSDLAGKAATSHTHAQSDITNLVSDLAARAALAGATFTGSVGVGAAPSARLHAEINAATEVLRAVRTGVRYWALDFGGAIANFTTDAQTYWQSSSGIFLLSNARTDATTKDGRYGIPHYTNSEEPFLFGLLSSASTYNLLALGGGSSLGNAATQIIFYTAANNTTPTGTQRLVIDSSGYLSIPDGGRLGIGKTPTCLLDLSGSTPKLRFTDMANSSQEVYLQQFGSAATIGTLRLTTERNNTTMAFQLHPKGVGTANVGGSVGVVQSLLSVFETDNVADSTNYSVMQLSMGAAGGVINMRAAGTATLRPFVVAMNGSLALTIPTTRDSVRIHVAKTPSGSGDTGAAGQICWDEDYLYVCTATDTWKRVALDDSW